MPATKCPPLFEQIRKRDPRLLMDQCLCSAARKLVPSYGEATADMHIHRERLQALANRNGRLGEFLVHMPRPDRYEHYIVAGFTQTGRFSPCKEHGPHVKSRSVTIWHTFVVSPRVADGGQLRSRNDIRSLLWHLDDEDLARLVVRPTLWTGSNGKEDITIYTSACAVPCILPPKTVLWAAWTRIPHREEHGFLVYPETITWTVTHEYEVSGKTLARGTVHGTSFTTRMLPDYKGPSGHRVAELRRVRREAL